jgi:hypothetical protein
MPTSLGMQAVQSFTMEDDLPPGREIDTTGWLAFGAGLALALLTEIVPFLRVLVGYFVVLVHELGHTLTGWLFGYPSIPAFDFTYGGGVTSRQDQVLLLVVAVYAVFAMLLGVFRANRASLCAVLALAVGYSAALLMSGADAVIIAMGHGAELLFATVFIHRAVSGRACHHDAERPLYAWIGFHIVFHDMRFAWGLLTNPFQREMYEQAKGGGHWMDFSRLAEGHFGVSLEAVAAGFLVLCFLPPLAGLLVSWLRPELVQLRERLGEI